MSSTASIEDEYKNPNDLDYRDWPLPHCMMGLAMELMNAAEAAVTA